MHTIMGRGDWLCKRFVRLNPKKTTGVWFLGFLTPAQTQACTGVGAYRAAAVGYAIFYTFLSGHPLGATRVQAKLCISGGLSARMTLKNCGKTRKIGKLLAPVSVLHALQALLVAVGNIFPHGTSTNKGG
jgi:hypothetical protein